jgi:hypothetical protein
MRRLWLALVVLSASACSILPGSAPAATPTPAAQPATAAPSVVATPTRPAATATATAAPKPTSTPAPSGSAAPKVYVGNTDGEGVYLRKTPSLADKLKAYADGTELTIIGDDVDGEGQTWKHVKTPDGTEGYVPAMYTTDTP